MAKLHQLASLLANLLLFVFKIPFSADIWTCVCCAVYEHTSIYAHWCANELLTVAFICIRACCVYVQTKKYDAQNIRTHLVILTSSHRCSGGLFVLPAP